MIQTKESTSPSQSLITRLASGPAEDTFLSTPLALRNTVDHLIDGMGALLWAAVLVQPEYGITIMVIRTIKQISMTRSFNSCQREINNEHGWLKNHALEVYRPQTKLNKRGVSSLRASSSVRFLRSPRDWFLPPLAPSFIPRNKTHERPREQDLPEGSSERYVSENRSPSLIQFTPSGK